MFILGVTPDASIYNIVIHGPRQDQINQEGADKNTEHRDGTRWPGKVVDVAVAARRYSRGALLT